MTVFVRAISIAVAIILLKGGLWHSQLNKGALRMNVSGWQEVNDRLDRTQMEDARGTCFCLSLPSDRVDHGGQGCPLKWYPMA